METAIKMGVLVIVSMLRLWVAAPLFNTARRNHLNNLYWLSAQFLCLVIALPFAAAGTFNFPWIFWTFLSLSEIALIMFVHTTFYHGRKSRMPVFMTLAVLGLVGGLYGNAINNFQLSAWFVYPNAVLIWGWNFVEAYRAYGGIAQDASTERWVKSRYLLMMTYSLVDCGGAVLGTLLTTGVWVSNFGSIIVVLINFTSVTLQILTWVMPESFRLWLNREQQARPAQEEQRPLSVLDVFGAAMTDGTGLKSIACLYAIRTTASKRIGSENSAVIQKYLNEMTYAEWDAILQHSELRRILINSGADEATAAKAIENARQALVEKQSLLTLGAR
ncbi:MAG: hypothetical protein WA821_19595 [Anaerolineales bacterium]